MRPLWQSLALALALICGSVATSAQPAAVSDDGLYKAEAIVTGTGEAERQRGFRIGAEEALAKLTGDATLAATAPGKAFMEMAAASVAAHSYEDMMKGIPKHDEQGTRDRPHYLRMQFDPARLDAALRANGLKKWEGARPLLAVWLGIAEVRKSYVLMRQGPEGYGQREVLKEASRRYAIPLVLPEAGETAVTYATIAKGDVAVMKPEAQASAADGILFGTLDFDGEAHWNTRWTLIAGAVKAQWTAKSATFDEALKAAIAAVASTSAKAK